VKIVGVRFYHRNHADGQKKKKKNGIDRFSRTKTLKMTVQSHPRKNPSIGHASGAGSISAARLKTLTVLPDPVRDQRRVSPWSGVRSSCCPGGSVRSFPRSSSGLGTIAIGPAGLIAPRSGARPEDANRRRARGGGAKAARAEGASVPKKTRPISAVIARSCVSCPGFSRPLPDQPPMDEGSIPCQPRNCMPPRERLEQRETIAPHQGPIHLTDGRSFEAADWYGNAPMIATPRG